MHCIPRRRCPVLLCPENEDEVIQIFLTYQIVEDLVLIVVTATRDWLQILVFVFRLYKAVVAPITVIEAELMLFSVFLFTKSAS